MGLGGGGAGGGGGGGQSRAAGAAGGALTGATVGAAGGPIGIAAGAVIGGALGALSSGGGASSALRPGAIPDIFAGGLSLRTTKEGKAGLQFRVRQDPFRAGLVTGAAEQFRGLSGQFTRLRQAVGPGFENVLASRLGTLETARRRTIGTISDNLSRRRVLGSSFGQAAIAQAEAEFAQAEANLRAETFLEQIDVESQLATQEAQAAIGAFNTELAELDTQLGLATGSLGALTGAATSISQLNAQLSAQAAAGRAAFGAEAGGVIGGLAQQFFGGLGGQTTQQPIRTDAAGRILGGI